MASKTPPQLQSLPTVTDADLYVVWNGSGPLKQSLATATRDYIIPSAQARQFAADPSSQYVNFIQSGTGAVSRTALAKMRDTVSVKDFGAVGDGVTDDADAFNAASAYLSATGGELFVPVGTYMFDTAWEIDVSGLLGGRLLVSAYGAEIKGSGAFSGVKITGKSTPNGVTVAGLKVNHRANGDAPAGIEATSTDHLRLVDCIVEAHGVEAGYAAVWLHNETPANDDTGCIWSTIENLTVRKRSGGDVGDMTHAVLLQGAANATTVRGGAFGSAANGVSIVSETGLLYVANAVMLDNVAFEGVTTAVNIDVPTTAPVSGLRIIGCRHETGTTFLSLTGATTQPATPPVLLGNYLTPEVTTYINNPNSLYVNTFDVSVNPEINASLIIPSGLSLRALNGTSHALNARPGGGGRGIRLLDSTGATAASLVADGAGVARLQGNASQLQHVSIEGLSAANTAALNFRGAVTLAAGTANVVFANAEPDANYYIPSLSGNASETFSWSAKATGGFTITSSNVASTAVVDWMIVR